MPSQTSIYIRRLHSTGSDFFAYNALHTTRERYTDSKTEVPRSPFRFRQMTPAMHIVIARVLAHIDLGLLVDLSRNLRERAQCLWIQAPQSSAQLWWCFAY